MTVKAPTLESLQMQMDFHDCDFHELNEAFVDQTRRLQEVVNLMRDQQKLMVELRHEMTDAGHVLADVIRRLQILERRA